MKRRFFQDLPLVIPVVLASLLMACSRETSELPQEPSVEAATSTLRGLPEPSAGNGGLYLPDDFGAVIVDEGVGAAARHIAVNDNGDIYINLQKLKDNKGLVALRDVNGDGKADIKQYFGDFIGTGIDIYKGHLYASSPFDIFRYKLSANELLPAGEIETLISGFPKQNDHWSKAFTFDNAGNIYVGVGSPSNACQKDARTPGSPGLNPCPQTEIQAGVWRFNAESLQQVHPKDGDAYATGIRNVVGLDWHFAANSLYVVQHGRDQLSGLWPNLYTDEQNAQLPAEEFLQVSPGDNYAWPYCYYDQFQNKKILGPEYGGDSVKQGRCADIKKPVTVFPGHLAPNDLLFYTGDMFPARYKNGAFIAFHGSWNRAPLPQGGYFVAFVPFENGRATGKWEIFAEGFAGLAEIKNPADAKHRPMGLAQGPDGSLYVTDSVKGKLWRIMHYGADSIKNTRPEKSSQAADASERQGEVEKSEGQVLYERHCLMCHQANGLGVAGLNPPLTSQQWVGGEKQQLIGMLLDGLSGATVDGNMYRNPMPSHRHLSDAEIAQILTYVRSSFGNDYEAVSEQDVASQRAQH